MVYERTSSYLDSFIKGLSTPPLELVLSLFITTMLQLTDILKNLFKYNGYSFMLINIILGSINVVLILTAIIDLLRNLIMGISRPGNAMFRLLGEIISLTIIYSAIIAISPSTLYTVILSVLMITIGIVFRLFVEIKNRRSVLVYL